MSLRHCVALLALASLLLLQFAAAESDPSAACSENCRFVVVPSLGPPGPAGPPGLNGTNGLNGKDGKDGLTGKDGLNGTNGLNGKDGLNATATIDTSIVYQKLKISDAELSGITSLRHAIVGPDAPTVCRGSTNETRLVLTTGRFGFAQIGSMIKWADGSVSIVVEAATPEQQLGTQGRINDEAVREEMDCLFYSGRNNFVSSNAYTKDGTPLTATAITSMGQPVIHHDGPGGARLVKLSLESMSTRNKAVWFFPAPPNAFVDQVYNDTFVGRDMVQTITNKVLSTRGRLTMGDVPILTIGSGDGDCNVTQTGTVLSVVGGGCTFSYASVGTLVTWPDGATSLVLSSFAEVGSRTATVSVSLERPTPTIVKVFGTTLVAQNFAVFQDKLALKGFTGGVGSCSVVLDMNRMKGGRSQSVWSFPDPRNPNAPVNYFVGEDVAQTISNKVVRASVIEASETNGHFRMTKYASLGIGGSIFEATGANAGYNMINVTITGNVLTADKATFFTTHIGCVIEWADGNNAVIQSVGPQDTEQGAFSATMTGAFQYPRDWQMVKMWLGNTMLSTSFSSFQDKIAVKAFIAGKTSVVTIDATKMRVDAGVRHQTVWTFPHPGPAGQQNYFVGEQTVQTLSNKILDAAKCNNGLTISSGGLAVPAGGLSITGGGLTVTAGGLTVMNGGLTVTHGITAATLTLQTGLTFQNGWITVPSAGLNVAGGPLIPESLRVNGVTELYDTLAIKSGSIEAPPEGLSITGGGLIGGLKVDRIEGNRRTASVACGVGTGAGGWAKFLDNSPSSNIAGTLHVNVGSTTVTNSILVIVSLNTPAPAVAGRCVVTLTAANQMAATLPSDKQVYVNIDRMTGLNVDRFEIWMVNPLTVGEYLWNYHVIC